MNSNGSEMKTISEILQRELNLTLPCQPVFSCNQPNGSCVFDRQRCSFLEPYLHVIAMLILAYKLQVKDGPVLSNEPLVPLDAQSFHKFKLTVFKECSWNSLLLLARHLK